MVNPNVKGAIMFFKYKESSNQKIEVEVFMNATTSKFYLAVGCIIMKEYSHHGHQIKFFHSLYGVEDFCNEKFGRDNYILIRKF